MARLILLIAVALLASGVTYAAWGAPVALAATVASVVLWAMIDGWRSAKFDRWLRGYDAAVNGAPGSTGAMRGSWGEIQYRIAQRMRKVVKQNDDERERLEHFLQAIQAAPNGVALLDNDDAIEWCNQQLAQQLGLNMPGDHAQRITYLVRHPEFVSYLSLGDYSQAVDLHNLGSSVPGRGITVQVQLFPFGEGNKLLLTRDITQEERADTMRRDFVANVSHELKTPLTVLKGFLETLQTVPLEPQDTARYLQLMQEQSLRMEQLVSDLLTLARLDSGVRSSDTDLIDMRSLLHTLQAEGLATSKGRHQVLIDISDAAPCVLRGSRSELFSAFSNMVSNAVRYTAAGGTVKIAWSVDDKRAKLQVSDTGIGIAAEHLPRLTERFYRVDHARSRDSGGTGLGLAIVKHALQRNYGELEISSVQGQGSIFCAVFERARVQ